MPRRLVLQAMREKTRRSRIPIYGYSVFDPKSKSIVCAMAQTLDVSYTALQYRLRELDLLEYHPIQEYLERHLGLGG